MFPIKNAIFPIKVAMFPIKNAMFPIKNAMFPIKKAIFLLKTSKKKQDVPMKKAICPTVGFSYNQCYFPQDLAI